MAKFGLKPTTDIIGPLSDGQVKLLMLETQTQIRALYISVQKKYHLPNLKFSRYTDEKNHIKIILHSDTQASLGRLLLTTCHSFNFEFSKRMDR